eukprot:PhM_4_TR16079/c4_g3_i1/m.94330
MTKDVAKRLGAAGADVTEVDGVTVVHFASTNTEAMSVYTSWAQRIGDPDVTVLFYGGKGTSITPASVFGVMLEAYSIAQGYQGLTMANFAGGALPPVVILPAIPPMSPNVHHAAVAGQKLVERIQQAIPEAIFPTINTYGPGTYLCTVQNAFSATLVRIDVFHG